MFTAFVKSALRSWVTKPDRQRADDLRGVLAADPELLSSITNSFPPTVREPFIVFVQSVLEWNP